MLHVVEELRRAQHHRHGAVPYVLVGIVIERAEARDARVVYEDVDAAEVLGDLCHYLRDHVSVRHVERVGAGVRAALSRHCFARSEVEIGHRDVRTLGGKQFRRRPAHAAGGPGDDRDPSGNGAGAVGLGHDAISSQGGKLARQHS